MPGSWNDGSEDYNVIAKLRAENAVLEEQRRAADALALEQENTIVALRAVLDAQIAAVQQHDQEITDLRAQIRQLEDALGVTTTLTSADDPNPQDY